MITAAVTTVGLCAFILATANWIADQVMERVWR
jgi:hypothetical protein